MRVSAYDYKVTPFFPHAYKLKKSIEAFSGTTPNTYVAGPSATTAVDKFYGSIILPDNNILFIPYSKNVVGLYNPTTNVYTDGVAVPTGSARYRGGCFHPQTGLAVFAPLLSPTIGIYDFKTGQFRQGPNLGASPGYHGAVVSSLTGKVILIPGTSTTVGIYDPITDTFTTGAAHGGTTTTYFSGGEELPDGNILLIPYSAGSFKIYNPVTNTISNGPSGTIASASFHGSVKLQNGDVVCVPYSAATVTIYRWQSNTLYTVACPAGGAKFRYGTLTSDGRVMFVPHTYDRIGWYDPKTNSYSETTDLGIGSSGKWAGAAQASNGKLIFTPFAHEFVGVVTATSAGLLPQAALQSIQWNKS